MNEYTTVSIALNISEELNVLCEGFLVDGVTATKKSVVEALVAEKLMEREL
ncbi:hypothetical protein [Halorubrum distributum]|uniref:Uncharacterized protein n=1 Tax=Halorubrum distributum TaxID=29283 RepID=A0A6B1IV56_9EURY|nr:hypothetical protein [Halorubrum terrestre]MYL66616.1 hypothetical protein [Halorubrum terrestre]